MKQLKLILLFFIFPILAACPEKDYKHAFRFDNNSDVDVYIYMGTWGRGFSLYPDTIIGAEDKCGVPFKKSESRYYNYNYEYDNGYIDVLSLFIFDTDTFDTYSWDEIKNNYKVLKRYDLSRQDLKHLNYIITYPPTEAMKNMKMYPPYRK
jgi:hypothetical protein